MTREEFFKRRIFAYMEVDFTFTKESTKGQASITETVMISAVNYDDEIITVSPYPDSKYLGRTFDVDIRHLTFTKPKPRIYSKKDEIN